MYNIVATLVPSFPIGSFILAGYKGSHKIFDGFKFRQNPTSDCGVTKNVAGKIHVNFKWEKCCDHSGAFIFDSIFFILADNKDNQKLG